MDQRSGFVEDEADEHSVFGVLRCEHACSLACNAQVLARMISP